MDLSRNLCFFFGQETWTGTHWCYHTFCVMCVWRAVGFLLFLWTCQGGLPVFFLSLLLNFSFLDLDILDRLTFRLSQKFGGRLQRKHGNGHQRNFSVEKWNPPSLVFDVEPHVERWKQPDALTWEKLLEFGKVTSFPLGFVSLYLYQCYQTRPW